MSTPDGRPLCPELPRAVQVEVSGACNLRCRMCLVRYAPSISRADGALSWEMFRDLVDGLPRLTRLTLQGLGEPLLSPHLLDMVGYAADRGVETGFNTNGVLLTRARSVALIARGLAWLHVSLDGATAATYEDVRHGTGLSPQSGQFDQVVGNIRALIEERASAGSVRPQVKIVFVAMRRNVAELTALVRLAADLGVDELRVQNLSHTFSDTDPSGAYADIRDYAAVEALFGASSDAAMRAAFREAGAVADQFGLALRLPELEPTTAARGRGEPGCSWPWDSAYVTHRGAVQPCCMVMGSDRATLGDLARQSFADVWHSAPYREFRARLLSEDPPDVCAGCSLYRGVF